MADNRVNCVRCGDSMELDESDIIFADQIGCDPYGPDTGWLCAECGLWEALEGEDG